MKELLAILIGLFTSMFNSLEYKQVDEQLYAYDSYYTIDHSDAPDYRDFYGTMYADGNTSGCRTTNYDAQGQLVDMGSQMYTYYGYWLENNVYKTIDGLSETTSDYTFNSEYYIIAPFDCTLITDSTNNNCETMIVDCSVGNITYRLEITNMGRWYCDVGRSLNDSNKSHTSDNQKGKLFNAGDVIGVAKNGTRISVTPMQNGKRVGTCTFKEMYEGTYTPESN